MAWALGSLVLLCLAAATPNIDTIEFQLNDIDSPIQDVIFCGTDSEIMLGLSKKKMVYRSENGGFSWRQLQTILQREGLTQTDNARSLGQVMSIALSPVDPRLIVMLGSKGINWFSDDCGKSVWALNYGKPIFDFQFHPTQRDWGLAASWTACSDLAKEPCELYKELYVTKNFKDWTFVVDYVVQFSWAQDSLEPALQRRIPEDRIYVTYIPNATGNQNIKGWTHKVDMVRSDDYFKTVVTLVPRGNKFIISSKYILVAQVVEEDSSEVQLLTSNERNLESFAKAELPIKHLTDHSYTLLDTSEGSIFLFVNHIGAKAAYGNVYISDSLGRRFSTSLLLNVQGSDGTCDFDKVYGLEGIYIANVYDKDSVNEVVSRGKRQQQKAQKDFEEESLKKSVITFDKGSIWKPIARPATDSQGKKLVCEDEDCSLHLHSLSYREFAPVYSTNSAVGLVLATGNIGSYLSHREDEVNTYMSRDGGLTWSEVRKGSHIYEIGDHGALIVMASNRQATDRIYYSWNEGMSWESLKFTSAAIEVENIIISPGAISQSFLVIGSKGGKGVTVAVDFSSLHEPQCRNPDSPGAEDSDYEVWTPNDGRAGSKCLMGRTVVYLRRKQEAECYNGLEFERATTRENCVCAEEDYECDIGYYREESGPCRQIPGEEPAPMSCQPGEAYYEIPTGYRRVAGNSCVGGVSTRYDPPRMYCATFDLSQSLFHLLLLLSVAGGGYFLYIRRDQFRDRIQKLIQWYSEPRYTKDFDSFPDTVDDDMVIREPTQKPIPRRPDPFEDFDPRR